MPSNPTASEVAERLTEAQRSTLLRHTREDDERWLNGNVFDLDGHAAEDLWFLSMMMQAIDEKPIWERLTQRSAVFGVSYCYRPTPFGLEVQAELRRILENRHDG